MPQTERKVVVFVHGWSVAHTKTYGGLPERLVKEASQVGLQLSVREIFLGKYVSFRDEVHVQDISRGLEAAVQRELASLVEQQGRFACITHSTGGPVVRKWWHDYYWTAGKTCPMSHLIMLAPANFGSALARLGKSKLSRIKTWFQGVEPGSGVLDWLELGSSKAWELNEKWIRDGDPAVGARGIFPFVLTGQSIDRKLYDHLNPYTGELGSDGVVRVASANLNATYVRLEQEPPKRIPGGGGEFHAPSLSLSEVQPGPITGMRVLLGKSHSGKDMGIMRSVSARKGMKKDTETVSAILDCLTVSNKQQYRALSDRFRKGTDSVQAEERLEKESRLLLPDSHFIHDRFAMVIFRLSDEKGFPISDADLLLTAGKDNDPDLLPQGFFADRQQNRRHQGTITYFLNYDIMVGCDAVMDGDRVIRERRAGAKFLGLKITPRPTSGFVHYLPCTLQASAEVLQSFLHPNQTTLVDIVLKRVVREGVFRFDRGFTQRSFKRDPEGPPIG